MRSVWVCILRQREGPKFRKTVRSMAEVEALPTVAMADALDYVMKAVTSIRHALAGRAPLFGFSR